MSWKMMLGVNKQKRSHAASTVYLVDSGQGVLRPCPEVIDPNEESKYARWDVLRKSIPKSTL